MGKKDLGTVKFIPCYEEPLVSLLYGPSVVLGDGG